MCASRRNSVKGRAMGIAGRIRSNTAPSVKAQGVLESQKMFTHRGHWWNGPGLQKEPDLLEPKLESPDGDLHHRLGRVTVGAVNTS
jgi:hypothetical protein